MLPTLSAIHLCFLSFLGSWLSWKRHFRWAVGINSIKSAWILFKCQDSQMLFLNVFVYSLFINSANTSRNEVMTNFILFHIHFYLYLDPNFILLSI